MEGFWRWNKFRGENKISQENLSESARTAVWANLRDTTDGNLGGIEKKLSRNNVGATTMPYGIALAQLKWHKDGSLDCGLGLLQEGPGSQLT